jgi:hypothetical protein
MTSLETKIVAGEPVEPLFRALRRIMSEAEEVDGMYRVSTTLPPEEAEPLGRALMRIEAELLVADAATVGTAQHEERTPPQRRHDALVLLAQRIAGSA